MGFLEEYSPVSRASAPYFTINPWSQAQTYESPHHIVSVDTLRHAVNGIGTEPVVQLIIDRLDMIELISTKESEEIIGHLKYNSRPPTSNLKKDSETRRLEAYLKLIGFKITYGSYKLSDVLDCLLGPLLVQQLKKFHATGFELVPALLEQYVSGNSIFTLSPTKSSASSATVDVSLPRKHSFQFGKKKVHSATFVVKRARAVHPAHITLQLVTDSQASPVSLDISKHLDFNGSCGTTIADHIYSVCYSEAAWLHIKHKVVGEVLNVFLHEKKALTVIQSLPLFLSVHLIKCKINPYLTTVLVDTTSQALQEAHLYVDSFELSPVLINAKKLSIQINSLAMHLFPTRDIESMVKIEGKCTLNKTLAMNMICFSTADQCKHVEFSFDILQTANDIFKQFGVQHIASQILGHSLDYSSTVNYNSGFVLSQVLGGTLEHRLTSIFFCIEPSNDCINQILPPSFTGHVENVKGKIVVNLHSTKPPTVGFEALFTLRLGNAELNCELVVIPSEKEVFVVQSNDSRETCGLSVLPITSAVDSALGKNIERTDKWNSKYWKANFRSNVPKKDEIPFIRS